MQKFSRFSIIIPVKNEAQNVEILTKEIYKNCKSMIKKNMAFDDIETPEHQMRNKVTIKNGKIINGVLDKSLLGAKAQGLIHIIFNDFGANETKEFLNSVIN